ncbi:MAG: DUF2380 domain-containing protein [Gammaproteobacteria bacterium]|nr:DUF2380 domain-containing protein [Gammaproteobacteria bacterium]
MTFIIHDSLRLRVAAAVVALFTTFIAHASPSVLVLDFGLDDDTLLPRVPKEVARCAALAPLVREWLQQLAVDVKSYQGNPETLARTANGYLVAHPEEAAALGRAAGADWVALGVQRKFSFLISWLRLYLIDAHTGRIVTRAEADLRGSMDDLRMTRRAAVSLADQMKTLIGQIEARRAIPNR